ncbi:MAG: GNAT family N-acetyltransferase [Clostridiales bacterium]|nr:GNAT family N-acetyltransferase [Clostridiales bacterium]
MAVIRFIEEPSERKRISRMILESLTKWFEVTESREQFIEGSADQLFWASFEDDIPTGFLCLKRTGKDTVELAVTGVLEGHQRMGTGRLLFEEAKKYAVSEGYSFMQVKTVRYGMYEDYDRTNDFYRSLGFKEFEVLEDLWDKDNPCQIYVMSLKNTVDVINMRHSYRGSFSSDPVPRKDLEIIATSGINAPSGCNKQTTGFIIVDDPEVLGKIKSVIDPPVAKTAPSMIVVVSKRINAYRDKCFATQDYAAAIENMLLTIVELGYQSCWYEGHITDDDRICDKIAEILGVPEDTDVVCILPVGKAEEEIKTPNKKAFEERVSFNHY